MRVWTLLLFFVWGSVLVSSSALRAETRSDGAVQRALAQAESHAIRGQIDQAIDAYRALLQEGVDNSDIRYNLGTLRLQQGDVGRAVLHLRTALRTDPAFEDARHHLDLALAERSDLMQNASGRGGFLWQAWQTVPMTSIARIFFGFAFLGAFFFAVAAWLPAKQLRAWGYRLCAAAMLLASIFGVMWYARAEANGREEAVVLVDELPARIGPEADAAVTFTAYAGLYGEALTREGTFIRLRLENGLDAWFPADALASVGSLPPARE